MNAPGDPLQKLLRQWQVKDELPSTSRREVWRRIEAKRSVSWREFLSAWLAPVPVPALAAITLLFAIGGGWAGTAAARAEKSRTTYAMAQAYLDAVDPEVRALKP